MVPTTPYRLAEPRLRVHTAEAHELPRAELTRLVIEIVEVESPVHVSEVVRRVATIAGAARAGRRIDASVRGAIDLLARNGRVVVRRGEFLWIASMTAPPLRDRSELPGPMRAAGLIAPEELELAVVTVVDASYGMTHPDAIVSAARLLGFQRTGSELKQAFDEAVTRLLAQTRLEARNNQLFVVER